MSATTASPNKSFRTTEEINTLLARLAALQDLKQGELLDAMIDAYLLVHSPTLARAFPAAAAVVEAKPGQVQEAIARLRAFLATDFRVDRLPAISELPSGRERLHARRAQLSRAR